MIGPSPSLIPRADTEVPVSGGPELPSLDLATQSTSIISQQQPHYTQALPRAS